MKSQSPWPPAIGIACFLFSACSIPWAQAADQRIQYTEQMVGAGHPTKTDTLNRLTLAEHNTDGTHKYLPGVDVRKYGAVCDGATDDSTAFAAAHTALPATASQNGGTILVPDGTCIIKNWTITKSGVTVQGTGSGYATKFGATVLRPPNGVTTRDDVIRVSSVGAFNVAIRDLMVYGLAPNNTDRAGSDVADIGTRTRLDNVVLTGAATREYINLVSGTEPDSHDGGGIFNSVIYGMGILVASDQFNVENTYFNCNSSASAIKVQGKSGGITADDLTISGTLIQTCATPVIEIGNATKGAVRNITIRDSRIDNVTSGTGPVIQAGDGTHPMEGFVMSGVQIRGTGGATPSAVVAITKPSNVSIDASNRLTATGSPPLVTLDDTFYGPIHIQLQTKYNGYVGKEFSYRHTGINDYGDSLGQFKFHGIALHTTDATPTPIFSMPALTWKNASAVWARVSANRPPTADHTMMAMYDRAAGFRNQTDPATQIATTTSIVTIEGDTNTDVEISLNGNVPQVVVTGTASTDPYDWLADVEWTRQ